MDSTNPYSRTSNFVDLLNIQQDSLFPEPLPYHFFPHGGDLGSSQRPVFTQSTETSSFCEDSPSSFRGRKKWSPTDDVVLISAWLNTSKDPVVGNEQKAGAFWQRISAYFEASPKVERGEKREPVQCKQRWQKLNDLVCKFCGSYEAATRQNTSGQSESDVKMAHEIFYNYHKKKFNLHHAWEELRHDQKWCEFATTKMEGSTKKRRCEDGAESSSSQATTKLGDQPTKRPPGVKAAKAASGKRAIVDHEAVSEFQTMWSIKEKDLAVKERLSKMGLLERLIGKKEPLSEVEEALKDKLITEMLIPCVLYVFLVYVLCHVSILMKIVALLIVALEEEDGAKVVRVEVTRVTSLSM
ncbi:PREDICTED: glutathione S-transferase T3-like [Brassica oleracea var. oleracea]|uniref:glutathione S-transferase T3-like n=1 Tax=Brassica oleracea var. oleracea TaxID=109376 RepID=UPI0006A6FDC0|nr:PREDICTED: glutathione S-transferase T3-like [Brassica oleracea var. oleracea]